MKGLTKRQTEILNFLYEFRQEKGFNASYRDIAEHFHFSTKAAFDHIKALQKKGIVSNEDNVSRSNNIVAMDRVESESFMISVPILGRVAAGLPLICEQNKDGEVKLSTSLLKNRNGTYFAMIVHGESMVDLGILDGDMAILEKCETAEDGEIIMATYGDFDGVTLKQIYFHPSNVELRPANAAFNPVFTRNCRVLGKLMMIVRNY